MGAIYIVDIAPISWSRKAAQKNRKIDRSLDFEQVLRGDKFMKLLDVQAKLLALKQDVLQTSDAAACLAVSIPHASQMLRRLSKAGFFISLARGKWGCRATIDPLLLPEFLTAPSPSYISFQSAL